MKTPILLLALILSNLPATAQKFSLSIPEVKHVILVALSHPDENGSQKSIDIVSMGKRYHFTPRNPITCIPPVDQGKAGADSNDNIAGLRLDSSRCFYRGQFSQGARQHTLLFFLGWAYASDPGSVFVLGFTSGGMPYNVLERKYLDVFSFEPHPKDGTALLIGFPSLSETMAGNGYNGSKEPYADTYDPRVVYVVRPGVPARYSLEESRRYNQRHYVWAGPKASEDYAVVYNYPGRSAPFGVPANELDALFAMIPRKNKP